MLRDALPRYVINGWDFNKELVKPALKLLFTECESGLSRCRILPTVEYLIIIYI